MTRHSKHILSAVSLAFGLALLLASPPAFAAKKSGNVGSGLIGNTVILNGPAGTTQIFYKDRDNLIIKMPDGKTRRGWWRVKGRSICTKTGDAPESCTPAVDIPPAAGDAGTYPALDPSAPAITWEIRKGRAFK